MKKVSVVMGIYNCTDIEELKRSIFSILNQTYENLEFIICDDGSTNDTYSELKKISVLDERIKIVGYKENKGLAFALNFAINQSTGIYIARQDADDISYPNRISVQVDFLEKNKEFCFVGSNCDFFNDNKIIGKTNEKKFPIAKDFLWNSPFIHPTIIFRKEILDIIHGYRVSWETVRAEDYDLFMRIYSKGYIGSNLSETLYRYKVEIKNTKYRGFKSRIQEAMVRYKGFKLLNLGVMAIPFILKPIVIAIIPQFIFKKIERNKFSQ